MNYKLIIKFAREQEIIFFKTYISLIQMCAKFQDT